MLSPDDYAFHTIHIAVDEEHGGGVGAFAERYLDTDDEAALGSRRVLRRRRGHPPVLGRVRGCHVVTDELGPARG